MLSISLAFVSCIKEVPISKIPFEKKLVIGCIANPDSSFRVNVRTTQVINDTANAIVDNAIVLLYNNGLLIDSLTHSQNGWYNSNIYPIAGQEYEIRASNNIAQGYAIAKALIPQAPVMDNVTFSIGKTFDSQNLPLTTYNFNLNDPIESNDYYELLFGVKGFFEWDPFEAGIVPLINNLDQSIIADSNLDYNPSSYYFSDALFNGTEKKFVLNISAGFTTSSTGNYIPIYEHYIIIRKISPSYYNYIRSWTVHRINQNTDFNTKERLTLLFQGDPVELYTNVENGYGIFGAYNEVVVQAQFVP
jgi:hypothetical protein